MSEPDLGDMPGGRLPAGPECNLSGFCCREGRCPWSWCNEVTSSGWSPGASFPWAGKVLEGNTMADRSSSQVWTRSLWSGASECPAWALGTPSGSSRSVGPLPTSRRPCPSPRSRRHGNRRVHERPWLCAHHCHPRGQ